MEGLRARDGNCRRFGDEDNLMFAIDLLKGAGIPQQSNWRQKAARTAWLLMPLAALALLTGAWSYDHSQLAQRQQAISENERLVALHKDQIRAYETASARAAELQKQLAEVAGALCTRVQVTDLFQEITQALPPEIFLYEINLDRTTNKEKYQAEGQKESRQRVVIRRSLTLVLCDFNASGNDGLVEKYVAGLKKSKLASSLFKEIKPADRQQGTVDEREAVYYYIECVLQEQIQNG